MHNSTLLVDQNIAVVPVPYSKEVIDDRISRKAFDKLSPGSFANASFFTPPSLRCKIATGSNITDHARYMSN